jgi:pimeloyl-ACP methyl ester carboxylesterase
MGLVDTCGMPETVVNGVALHYEDRGAGAPILCVHGTGSSCALWAAAAEELATRGRALVYDRRGFGRSGRPDPLVMDVGVHADDAAALLAALGAGPAIVIGRSQGGEIAVDLARRHPGCVRALALLEGGGLALSAPLVRWLADLDREIFAAAEDDVGTVGEVMLRRVLGDDGWEAMTEPVRAVFRDNGPAIVAEERGGLLEVTAAELASIRHPALVVAATDSPPALADAMRAVADALPAARLARVEGGHLISPAHPAVLDFVDEVLAAR